MIIIKKSANSGPLLQKKHPNISPVFCCEWDLAVLHKGMSMYKPLPTKRPDARLQRLPSATMAVGSSTSPDFYQIGIETKWCISNCSPEKCMR